MMASHNFINDDLSSKFDQNSELTICNLIGKIAQENPEGIAIIDGHRKINYQTLLQRAGEISEGLKSQNFETGALIGVCMERSWELVATLLGVMQAGYTYVPLDPTYPKDRVHYILEHSKSSAAIVDNDASANLCSGVGKLIWLSEINGGIDSVNRASAKDLAYVIYTSGSTGNPKGVAIEHRSIVAMVHSMHELFTREELSGVLAAASICFDTSVMEIFGTLSLGGTIILAENALELTKLPAKNQVKTCVMVASSVQAILSSEKLPEELICLVFGGEALKRSLVEQVYKLKPGLRVFNAYGPTEDTVYSTIAELSADTSLITIGKSVTNSRAYILDDAMQPLAAGVAGELYLAGSKLARGYLNDDALTKERFIEKEPTGLIPDSRLYRTGDLCQWTKNGEIEFLGRVDQQVKIRGFRIELEEIESTLESMQGIDTAAAAAVEGGIGQKLLAVFVVSRNQTIDESKVKTYLSNRLPKYMVPQVVKQLNDLPLLPNDKLDRKKLMTLYTDSSEKKFTNSSTPNLNRGNGSLKSYIHSATPADKASILSIIRSELVSILNIGDSSIVTSEDSFINLGLDSLSTLEFSSRLSKLLKKEVPANAIFKHATPMALANYIINTDGVEENECSTTKPSGIAVDSLASLQKHLQSSHPTFQAAKVTTWSVNDKSKFVQEVLRMVNDNRRNPYSKVLRTGSGTRGVVGDAYNDEEQEAIIWTTNLYLGLNRDPEVIEEATKSLTRFGTGMGTSAAASGLTNQHLEFEREFADLVGKPGACLFPTGYTANVGAIAGLLGKNDVVIIDQLCHASIVDGARLCGAGIRTFKHNDVLDLQSVLESEASPYRTMLVVLEGVYSMGEGAAPVAEIVRMAKKYNALVLVDEAHSFGFYGEGGAGICADQGVTEEVDFIMTTLSKALGSLGGVVAASKEHIDLLKSSSRAYIFQASISPADMAAALTALRRLRSDDELRKRLWDTTRYMRKQFEKAGYDLGTGDGPIVTPHFKDKDKLYAIVQALYQRGVQTSAVTYPIVEIGRGRLRFICSANHTREDVDKTLDALQNAEREVDEILKADVKEKNILNISSQEIKEWMRTFTSYLESTFTESTVTTPNLEISISLSGDTEKNTISIIEGKLKMQTEGNYNLPSCNLHFTDNASVNTLLSNNVQGLIHAISKGACKLKGQVEPFIYFFARLVERKRSSTDFLQGD